MSKRKSRTTVSTVGELPVGAPFCVRSEAIIATVTDMEILYWIAPEALVSSMSEGTATGTISGEPFSPSLEVSSFAQPVKIRAFRIDQDEVDSWRIRMLPVTWSGQVPEAPMIFFENVGEDRAAEVSHRFSLDSGIVESLSDEQLWHGDNGHLDEFPINPMLYIQEKFRIGAAIAAIGAPVLHYPDALGPTSKVMAGAMMKNLLDNIIEQYSTAPPHEFVRLVHCCVALYALSCRSGLFLPKQVDPEVFDASYRLSDSFSNSWSFDADKVYKVLGLLPVHDGRAWEQDDIAVEFDEEDSKIIAHLQGVDDKYPDGRFKAFLVYVRDENLRDALMPVDDMIDHLADHGVYVELPDDFPEDARLAYATEVHWRNSAFREWMEKEDNPVTGLTSRLFDNDDDSDAPEDLPGGAAQGID